MPGLIGSLRCSLSSSGNWLPSVVAIATGGDPTLRLLKGFLLTAAALALASAIIRLIVHDSVRDSDVDLGGFSKMLAAGVAFIALVAVVTFVFLG